MEHGPSTGENDSRRRQGSSAALLRRGWLVFGVLMVIEIEEYGLSLVMKHGSWPFLALLALVGAAPIVLYFMHIPQLWRTEE